MPVSSFDSGDNRERLWRLRKFAPSHCHAESVAARLILLIIFIALPGAAPALAQAPSRSTPDTSDIVVTGHRSPHAPNAIDRYSEKTIRTLGAMTIGEVIERLERRNGGQHFSIIINGRRLSDISDLQEVPPEALAEIEVLPTSSADSYGFPPQHKVLNLVLKPQFASASADVGARLPTDGGGNGGSAAARYVNIRNEKRFNASVVVREVQALNGRDREGLLPHELISPLTPYRVLLPYSRAVTFISGGVLPLGTVSLNASLSFNNTVSRQLTRFFRTNSPTTLDRTDQILVPSVDAQGIFDTSRSRTYQLALNAASTTKHIFWTAELTGAVTASGTTSDRAPKKILGLPPDGELSGLPSTYVPLSASSTSLDMGAALSANGPIFSLPSGQVTANTRLTLATQRLHSSNGGPVLGRPIYTQTRSKAHIGLNIPIISSGLHKIGFLGNLSLSVNGDYEKISNAGSYPSHDLTVEWRPTGFLSLSLSKGRVETVAAFNQYRGVVLYTNGVQSFDISTGNYALVTQISGSSPELLSTAQKITLIDLELNKSINNTAISANITYSSEVMTNPIIAAVYPTALFQQLFPNRFIRDSFGHLTTIDTRPFNAVEELRRTIRSSLHLSGSAGKEPDSATDLAGVRTVDWDISVSHEWALQDILVPSLLETKVNLLRTPLDGVQGTPRHKINVEAGATYRSFNLQFGAKWRSAVNIKDISSSDGHIMNYASFWTADARFSWTLRFLREAQISKPLRISLTVENLLGKRLDVRDPNGQTPRQFLPAMLDPVGRLISIRASQNF